VPFIALEWLEGESLTEVVRQRHRSGKPPLDLARAVRLLGPAARALERAHAFPTPEGPVSVIHRDLKPDNVFIAKIHGQQVVKLLDFGISKVKSEAAQIAGQASSLGDTMSAFTPAYGSPEQWLPKRFGQTGPWTDVWGLALTLVETITGKQPLEGDMHAVLGACVDEKRRPSPRYLGAAVSDDVEALFLRALAVDPQARFARVGEFWDALEAAVGTRTPRFGAAVSALDSVIPPTEAEETLPGMGFRIPTQLAAELAIEELPSNIPDLELETSVPVNTQARKRSLMMRRSELPLMGNNMPIPGVKEARLVEPLQTALEVEMPAPSPSRRRPPEPIPSVRATRAAMSGLVRPVQLIALAVLLMIADFLYTQISGDSVSIGPVRIFWIAGPMAGAGLIWLLRILITGEG
jgi:serine/threonine-protein kinase